MLEHVMQSSVNPVTLWFQGSACSSIHHTQSMSIFTLAQHCRVMRSWLTWLIALAGISFFLIRFLLVRAADRPWFLMTLTQLKGRNVTKRKGAAGKLRSTDLAGRDTTTTTTTDNTKSPVGPVGGDSSPVSNTTAMPWHEILVNCKMDASTPRANEGVAPLICPQSRCLLKAADNGSAKARAVVFNPLWPISQVPLSKPAGQLWVYSFFFEAPDTHQLAKRMTARLSSKIDLTMTFHPGSDIFRPYQAMLPLTSDVPPPDSRADPSKKEYLLVWTVSNCGVGPRNTLFKELQSRLGSDRVHLYGGCGKKHPCRDRFDTDCEIKFYSQYKFYAAFENSRCSGYITEKFYRGFQKFMIPLAYGGIGRMDYEHVAPKDSFLHVDDFGSLDDLTNTLKEIDRDDARYSRFHEWRQKVRFSIDRSMYNDVFNRSYCEICDRIDHPKGSRPKHDLDEWVFNSCTSNQPHWNSDRANTGQHLPWRLQTGHKTPIDELRSISLSNHTCQCQRTAPKVVQV